MSRIQYILDESGNPKPEPDLIKWATWFEKRGGRIVKQEQVGEVWVSTVFLGLDHDFSGEGPPILWETMTLRRGDSLMEEKGDWEEQDRCSGNREQAEAMHQNMVERVKAVELLKHETNKQI